MSTATSFRSDSPVDDEDRSSINNDETQYLPQPDIIASIKKSPNLNEEYCNHLKQMADLANQQSSSNMIPFFGKDDHMMNTESNQKPTTTLEKNLLFN